MTSPFACSNVLRDCECIPFPARNFSVETVDVPVCFAHFNQAPFAGTFFAPGCFADCTGVVTTSISECETVTQQCAERAAIDCTFDGPGGHGPDNPGTPPPGGTLFNNAFAECTVTCPDGSTTTEFVDAGTIRTPWQADADARAAALACKLARRHQICFVTESPLASVCANEVMSVVFDVAGGRAPYVFAVDSGSIPSGTELNEQGNLFGTPHFTGTSMFTLRVTDSNGAFQVKEFTIRVVSIDSPSTLPSGTTGTPYSYTFLQTGAASPLWTVASGALPAGLTLTGSGLLSGTPTAAATSNFTVTLLDAGNEACSKDFSIQIAQAVGLVGYWSYDDYVTIAFFNYLLDATPNNHDLLILNAYNVVAGKVGNCMSTFENTCDTTSDLSEFNYVAANGFTVCGWTKFDFDQTGTITIWAVNYGIKFFLLEFNTDSMHLFTSDGDEVFAPYPADGNWHFFRAWVDTNKILNLQIDLGTIFQSNDPIAFGDLTCTHFQLQGDTTAIPDTLNGFDEAGFWKRVLSNSEASQLWNSGTGVTWPSVPP